MKRLTLAIATVAIASSLSLSACGNQEQTSTEAPLSPKAREQTSAEALTKPETVPTESETVPTESEAVPALW